MLSKTLCLLEAGSLAPAGRRGKGKRGVQATSGFLRAHFIHRKSAGIPSFPPLARTARGTSGSSRKSLSPWPRPLPGRPLLTQPVLMTTLQPKLCHLHPERRPVDGSADAPMMPLLCALCCSFQAVLWGACPLIGWLLNLSRGGWFLVWVVIFGYLQAHGQWSSVLLWTDSASWVPSVCLESGFALRPGAPRVASRTGFGERGRKGGVRFISRPRTTCASGQDGTASRAACAPAGVFFLAAPPQPRAPVASWGG